MSEIGDKMFKGAAIGGAVGAVGGGIYGGIKAQQKIENLPTDQVTLSGYERPVYEEKVVGRNTNINIDLTGDGHSGANSYTVTAKYPVRNPDGTLRMEQVPSQVVVGHGKAIVSERIHEIKEPVSTDTYISVGDNFGDGVNVNTHTSVKYKTVGYWKEPTVKFETGVSRLGYILGYAAAGAGAGAVGGALIAVALDKAGK